MLRAIEIENFKAFGQRVRADLAPITLVYGQNSSGKSSLLNAIRWLGQNHNIFSSGLARSTGRLADLGSYRALLFKGDFDRHPQFTVEFETSEPSASTAAIPEILRVGQTYKPRSDARGLVISDLVFRNGSNDSLLAALHIEDRYEGQIRKAWELKPQVTGEVGSSKSLWQERHQYYQENAKELVDYLKKQPSAADIPPDHVPGKRNAEGLVQLAADWSDNIRKSIEFYSSPRRLEDFIARMNEYMSGMEMNHIEVSMPWHKSLLEFSFLSAKDRKLRADASKETQRTPFETPAPDRLTSELGKVYMPEMVRLRSLGSIRAAPLREYRDVDDWVDPDQDDLPSIGLNGEKWPLAVYNWSGGNLEAVNKWLGLLGSHHVLETRDIREEEPRLFEIRAKSVLPDLAGIQVPIDVNWADIGYGICQFVPIIVLAQHDEPRTVLLEQPELHAHPQMQVEMAELFIDGYLTHGHQFIIETHSEHLLLRILKAIRKRRLKSSDVSILFVERGKTGEGSTVRRLELDPDGEFMQAWPRGFMAERLDELA